MTSTSFTNGTGAILTFPDIRVTSAPLSIASFAIAYPIFPVELFDIKRTGSIISLVGPAVTQTFIPFISFFFAISLNIYHSRTSGDGIFPFPVSPHARYPLSGSMISIP